MKDLVPIGNEKNDAFTRILASYELDSTVVLTAEEEKIRSRWLHCDKLLRSRKYKSADIIQEMVGTFSISKFTAEKDIANTYALFGQLRVMSKQYVITHAIEDIQLKIQRFENDKSLVALLPKLYAELARFTAMLPDEVAKKQMPAPSIVIGSLTVNNNTGEKPVISIDEARQRWKERKSKAKKDDYTDFEDVDNS